MTVVEPSRKRTLISWSLSVAARAAIALPDAPPAAPPAILTATVSCLPNRLERSICRIDSTTPQSRHCARFRRLIVSRASAGRACGPSACASSKPPAAAPCLDDARSSGILCVRGRDRADDRNDTRRGQHTDGDAGNPHWPACRSFEWHSNFDSFRCALERALTSSPAIYRKLRAISLGTRRKPGLVGAWC